MSVEIINRTTAESASQPPTIAEGYATLYQAVLADEVPDITTIAQGMRLSAHITKDESGNYLDPTGQQLDPNIVTSVNRFTDPLRWLMTADQKSQAINITTAETVDDLPDIDAYLSYAASMPEGKRFDVFATYKSETSRWAQLSHDISTNYQAFKAPELEVVADVQPAQQHNRLKDAYIGVMAGAYLKLQNSKLMAGLGKLDAAAESKHKQADDSSNKERRSPRKLLLAGAIGAVAIAGGTMLYRAQRDGHDLSALLPHLHHGQQPSPSATPSDVLPSPSGKGGGASPTIPDASVHHAPVLPPEVAQHSVTPKHAGVPTHITLHEGENPWGRAEALTKPGQPFDHMSTGELTKKITKLNHISKRETLHLAVGRVLRLPRR